MESVRKKARDKHFSPRVIRAELDTRDGYKSEARKEIYGLLSDSASHPTYRGFVLVTNAKNLGQIGPFFDERKLAAWLQELAKRLPHAALHLTADPEGRDLKLMAARAHYLKVVDAWRIKYLSGKSGAA